MTKSFTTAFAPVPLISSAITLLQTSIAALAAISYDRVGALPARLGWDAGCSDINPERLNCRQDVKHLVDSEIRRRAY